MARRPNLSYEKVAAVCDMLAKAGETPSMRKIQQHCGGDPKHILEFIGQWNQNHSFAAMAVGSEISDPLRQALIAEFGRVTATIKERLEEQLEGKTKLINQAKDFMDEYQGQIESLKDELEALKKSADQERLNLEKQIAALEARNQDYDKREKIHQQQIDSLREQKHESEIKTARAETECKELQKQKQLLEQQIKILEKKGL